MTAPPLPEGLIQQALFDELIEIFPEDTDSRGGDWRRAECACQWSTTADENPARDAAYEHIADVHMRGLPALADFLRRAVTAPLGPAEPDEAQARYLAHQARKREVLSAMMAERHSDRWFADEDIALDDLAALLQAALRGPSSCDRQGVYLEVVNDRDTKALLGGLLVGGVGWVHRAPTVIMLFADRQAYKAGDEITYMPLLDAGVIVGHLGIAAASLGLAGCFINPNVRADHMDLFRQRFGSDLYCGAYAVGLPREGGAQCPPPA